MSYALAANPHKNFYPTRHKRVDLIGLHVTAGLQDLDMEGSDQSAEGTNRYGATTSRQASWHKCVDSDSIADALPDEYTAWHIRNYNSNSLGLEISNRDARWDNKPLPWVNATLRNAAKVCHAWEKKFNIPRRLLTKAQVDAGERGYTYHRFLDAARRTDPGTTFPWALFVELLEQLDKGEEKTPTKKPDTKDDKDPGKLKVDGDFGSLTVARLQESLNRTLKTHLELDGDFGPNTKKALQRRLKVDDDGKIGPQTIRALQRRVGASVDGDWGSKTTAALQRLLNKTEL
jgi:hypothetical protein